MFHNVKKAKLYLLRFGAALCLSCTITLFPVAKVHGEELSASSGNSEINISPVSEKVQQEPPSLQQNLKNEPAGSSDSGPTGKPLDKPAYSAPDAIEDEQDKDNTLLIVGAGAAAAAVLALALSGGGGGGGGTVEPEPTSTAEPVGADIAGDTWAGYLDLVNGRRENVTAVVTQDGSQVQITTSTTQSYGKVFSGTIYSDGDMLVYDQATGEDWTTFKDRAFSTQIDLYDYVNNFTGIDRLFLKR